jgi:hypothetical protein
MSRVPVMNPASARQHLIDGHGWSESDFGLYGDTVQQQAIYMDGAHGQEHEYNQAKCNHTHGDDEDEVTDLHLPDGSCCSDIIEERS